MKSSTPYVTPNYTYFHLGSVRRISEIISDLNLHPAGSGRRAAGIRSKQRLHNQGPRQRSKDKHSRDLRRSLSPGIRRHRRRERRGAPHLLQSPEQEVSAGRRRVRLLPGVLDERRILHPGDGRVPRRARGPRVREEVDPAGGKAVGGGEVEVASREGRGRGPPGLYRGHGGAATGPRQWGQAGVSS